MTDMRSGISKRSREQLARLTSRGRHLVTVDDATERLNLTRSDAAKLLARWSQQGWLRRVRRGLYIAVPVDVENPELWSEDPMVLATAVWSPCYFTGWTAGSCLACPEHTSNVAPWYTHSNSEPSSSPSERGNS